jgi:class 3 adenylate cyclase
VTGAGESPDLAAIRAALDELADTVRKQSELIGRIALRLGIDDGDVDLHKEASAARDNVLWQRLGLVEGERRNVTVLFTDVSGFTALSEQLDPEEFQLVMKDTMSAIAAVISRYDGYLEKFIGDAVCAIFGAPVAHDDEPQRAARSALEINRVLAARAASRPDLPALRMHAGINTGVVIAGTVGDGSQFGVMGDTINTASRLLNLAREGEIFVSAETARRLRREFRLEDRGAFEVKGKQHPVAAFNVLDELPADERGGVGRLASPFVNRQVELSQLQRLAEAAAAGDGAAVLVVGEPGVGKTRLADELVQAVGDSFHVIRGSARVVGEQPLGVLIDAIESQLTSLPDGPEKDIVMAAVREGASVPPEFEITLARVLASAAFDKPLLVLLDDIESADRGSLELTRYLARATAHVPILWLLAARWAPPLFDAAAGDDDVVTVQLRPLDDDDMATLLDGLLPGVLDRMQRARLAYQADGIPEFAEEIVLAMIDQGVVAQSGEGGFRLIGDPEKVEIPSSVAELVEARIDRVATNARVALQEAAVIGLRFSRVLLAAVASASESLEASLAELAAAELVVPPPEDSDPRGYWMFRSHVVREVAYDSILRRRRPRMHRAVADALCRLEPERAADNVDLIASHYELSDEPANAIPYLRTAVEDAEAAHSVTGAAERARRALSIRERQPEAVLDVDAAWFLEHLGIARAMLGDQGGREDMRAAVLLHRAHGEVTEEAWLEERVGWYLTISGDPAGGGHHLVRAQELADTDDVDERSAIGIRAAVAVSRAFAAGVAGRLTVALDAVDGAAAEAREVEHPFTEARALLVNGVLWLWEGKPNEARGALRSALDLAWQHGFAALADRCGRWLVQADVEAGNDAAALELAEQLLARADERGDPSVAVGVRAALAELWRERGDTDRARAIAREAVAIATERSVAVDAAAEAYLTLAAAALDIDEPADEPIGELADLLARDPWLAWRLEARLELTRARAALAAGDHAEAARLASSGRLRLDRAAARRERIVADRVEGEALVASGDASGLELLDRALSAAEALGSRYLVAETATALARAADALGEEHGKVARTRADAALAAVN